MKNYLLISVLLLLIIISTGTLFLSGCTAEKDVRPNFIVFLVDDLGWIDTGCYGSAYYETPVIDMLASQGMRFTNAYSAHPVCGPSRAALLSGKTPARLGNLNVGGNLKPEEKTIAEVMKEAGYVTFFAGKWHLGMKTGQKPGDQGFDYAVGFNHGGQPGSYFYPYRDNPGARGLDRKAIPAFDVLGFENGAPGEFLTDRLTSETIDFINQHKDNPFFVYLSHYDVHSPLEGNLEYIQYFEKKNDSIGQQSQAELIQIEDRAYCRVNQSNPIQAAKIKSVDQSLGKIMHVLEKLNLEKNTVIIFTSDNGGSSCLTHKNLNMQTSNSPLRYGKGWLYEGGIRVPALIKWPGKIIPGSVSDLPICLYDFYPTILDMAGLPLIPSQHQDGESILAFLNGNSSSERTMFWYYPFKHGTGHLPSAAVRKGDLKLIWHKKEDRAELYNLKNDISEQNELSEEQPEVKKELRLLLDSWIAEMKQYSEN